MRIVAGSAGGIPLLVPKRGVRPTMDRVKAAIFSSLADKIVGAHVLDLFAGSGALGIEALSRGAADALFVEQDRQSIAAIEKNLARTRLEGRVRQQNVLDFLRQFDSPQNFDLIFADPPYEKTKSGERFSEKLLSDENLPRLLAPEGIFILEKRPGETLPQMRLWHLIRQKTYGATEVVFLSAINARPARTNPQSAIDR